MDNLERLDAWLVRIIVGVYAVLSLLGFLAFVSTKAVSLTQAVAEAPPTGLEEDVNLALLENGAWIEASSYAYHYIHHPLFVIDGLTSPPSTKEQWVPDKRSDEAPSLAVHLARPSLIREVVVYHDPRYTDRSYILSCSLGGEAVTSVSGSGRRDARETFDLACESADEVRLDFDWNPDSSGGHIRIYEIMVIGR
ncbi:MAG: hypothetical protein JRG91_05470 [Deltaproteobacteria bacterium]|nr:hypothetical protein [Deltaproteobacteria bacterium]